MLVYYKGETDQSLRSKLMMARPYFDAVTKSGNTEYEKYDICKAYSNLASFYEDYVIDAGNSFVFDAGKKEYSKLIKECNGAVDLLESPKNKGTAKLKTTTYAVILSILDTQKSEISMNIPEKNIDALIFKIEKGYQSVETGNAELEAEKADGLKQCARIKADFKKSYTENKKVGGN